MKTGQKIWWVKYEEILPPSLDEGLMLPVGVVEDTVTGTYYENIYTCESGVKISEKDMYKTKEGAVKAYKQEFKEQWKKYELDEIINRILKARENFIRAS